MKAFLELMKEGNLFHRLHWKNKWKWLVKEKGTNENVTWRNLNQLFQ
jgi:hypothetical protein